MRTLVYGMGESGVAACRALLESGVEVVAADARDGEDLRQTLTGLGVEGQLGVSPEVLEGVDRVVASPGVPPHDPVLSSAHKRSVPVVSEVSLGLSLLGPGVRVAAVTGTNGKTTVTGMLDLILSRSGINHTTAGNSWRALCGCLEEVRESGVLVLELSSFQLHYLEDGEFEVAALLNVSPDHLNWHASFGEYAADKLRIFERLPDDGLALASASDAAGPKALRSLDADKLLVGEAGTRVEGGELLLGGERLISEGELGFWGRHNHENALFAAAAAPRLGAGMEGIREGLRGYRPDPHRMEVVAEKEGILYIDDSKATNPAAVAAALSGLDRNVVLILGGSEKQTDFSDLSPQLGRCRAVVCQGEAGPRLLEYVKSRGVWAQLAGDLEEACRLAEGIAESGDVVLLSPGCASFDQFPGYGERGKFFAALARGG